MASAAAGTGDVVVTLDDIERFGCDCMIEIARRHCNSGSDEEQTLRENRMAYQRLRLRPRVLRNVAQRQLEATLLGNQRLSMPIGISPTALHKLMHPDGEIATARAAQAERTLMILSAYSSTPIEAVKREVPDGLIWFHVQFARDRNLTRDLVRRAEVAGCRAVVLTADAPVLGAKVERIKRCSAVPDGLKFANFEGTSEHEFANYKSAQSMTDPFQDPAQTWDDVTWLKGITSLPVVIKGITTAEDAEEAVKRGVSAILVSNHGGRLLDGLPATIEILPEIVSAVHGRVEVYLDGGVRQGTDVVKALALGAKAVFVGRPALWGLAYRGEAGVRQMLEILRQEFDRALALMGSSSISQLGPEMVVHEHHFSRSAMLKTPTSNKNG
ncbi:unnamed protein product [Ixodes hexagonus]